MDAEEFEREMHLWREAEDSARRAEERLRQLGQVANDPRVAGLSREAAALRRKADEILAALVRKAAPPAG